MTPEEIKALIKAMLVEQMDDLMKPVVQELQATVQNFIVENVSELEDKVKAISVPPTNDKAKPQPEPEDSITVSRIAKLEADLQAEKALRVEQEQRAKELRFDQSVSTVLDAQPNLVARNTVKELITNRFKGAEEKEGKWLNAKGNELGEYVSQFLASDEGKLFTAPTHRDGTASTSTSNRNGDKPKMTLDQALASLL